MEEKNNRRNLLILFFTMIVVMLGFGMIIPILPFYVKSFGASGSALGALMATYGILQFIFAPLWGGLSDRIGRKPVLMIGVLGNAIAQLLFGFSTQLWMLFAARALAGSLSVATLPTAMAYIGDSTTKEKRSGGMGMIGAAMGVGMVLGPGVGGLLARQSLSFPFFIASGLSVLALVLILLFLPEPEHAAQTEPKKTSQPQIGLMIQALTGPLGILFVMAFLLSFGLTNFEGIFGLYAADRYAYSTVQVGLLLTIIGLIAAFMQGVMTGPITQRIGDVTVIRLSLLGSAIGFVLMTQADTLTEVILTVSFYVISNAMLNPTVASLISRRTDQGQGVTMGLTNSFLSLGRIIGPLWAGFVYDIQMNLPYLTGAVILLVGFGLSIWKLSPEQKIPEQEASPEIGKA